MVNSFGDRWMASGTIASIEEWERSNSDTYLIFDFDPHHTEEYVIGSFWL